MFTKEVKILIIDDNSPFVLPLLRSFSDSPEIKVSVLLTSVEKPNMFRYSRFLKTIYYEQITEENFERTVKAVIRKSLADLIIPTREWISKLVYQHRKSLEEIVKIHPVSNVNTLNTINDKWELSNWLEKNGFPFARAFQIGPEGLTDKILHSLSFPVLLKPRIGIGGYGIKLIGSKEDLKSAVAKNEVYSKEYFIQEFIDGYDIDISFFAIDGKILFYTIQKGLITGRLTYSKGIEFIKNQDFYNLTSDIVTKLNYSGIAHLDFRFDSGKGTFVLIDFNARYWSSLEGSRIRGVNFPILAAAYSLGIQFDYPEYSAGTYYFAATAIKTFIKNLYSKKKYPVKLFQSELRLILIDPMPEITHSGKKIIKILEKGFQWIRIKSGKNKVPKN